MAKSDLKVTDILSAYPDCPQREMALRALRKGHPDLALEWLNALQDMIADGRASIERDRLVAQKRRA
ncbi:hypothetical protein BXY66_4090 [Shimia isoporae]|uniref:Uncharacterized protein n=1 Tax=Shimia isoporae TaxID=647720 RepID=A0A4R1MZR5_9RHOB|nr:hypothetical protein [Shimia isoporae]TCK98848.1 hypothetical protein BXY66_4090 [Shimia isoporae]